MGVSQKEMDQAMMKKNKFWKPAKVGDGIQGVFVEWVRSQFKDFQGNDVYNAVIRVEVEPGFEMNKELPKQCTDSIYTQDAKLGDLVTVSYEGEMPGKGEHPKKIFKCVVTKK